MITGIKNVINNLMTIEKKQDKILSVFLNLSYDYIVEKAIETLMPRLNNEPDLFDTNITNPSGWEKIITNFGKGIIIQAIDDNSASIEFGIGIEGKKIPHVLANQVGYEYDVPSQSKDEFGRWTFLEKNTQKWYVKYSGYDGKSFLYDTFIDYFYSDKWVELYDLATQKVLKSFL